MFSQLPKSLPDICNLTDKSLRIAVVIPCFRVKEQILKVLDKIGEEISAIYCVDDHCDCDSGQYILANNHDPRVQVIFRSQNGGVGAATITGYLRALEDEAAIIVKLDGDGQMDPTLIPKIIKPIIMGEADYCKGNRLYNLESMKGMPFVRLIGSAVLSLMSKFSSGYWDIADSTNGFTAIDGRLAQIIPWQKLSQRYFFESDLLFRLNTLRAAVVDVPMNSYYGSETSNMRISEQIFAFTLGHLINFIKRIYFNYCLRGFSIATVGLFLGLILFSFGFVFGCWRLAHSSTIAASPGIVMLACLPIIVGLQFLLAFFKYDMNNMPRSPIATKL